MCAATIPTKADLRAHTLAARRTMTAHARDVAGAAITRTVLGLPEIAAARSVAAYLSFGTEPATKNLIEVLWSRHVRVLVPVVRSDLDLDWAEYAENDLNIQNVGYTWKPARSALGPDAISSADAILVPALAVDERGMRLGRGGGCYDRALARVGPACPILALVYDGECPVVVPSEPHDRPVTAAVTPHGMLRFA